MEDVVISITAKLAEYLVIPILRHARYLCCFNNFAGELSNAKKELELARQSVKEQARRAINRTEKIEPTVEKWLKDVDNVIEDVQKLQDKIMERKGYNCFRYFLAKEVVKKTQKMIVLRNNAKFEPFSQLTELPGMAYFSSKNFVLFKSTKSTYDKLLEALKANNKMIGLHGMGGSGKTTLVKEVGKKAEELNLFDKVVMATMTQTLNVRALQDQIADQLDLKLGEQSELGRAKRLSQRLRNGDSTLVILYDVWERLDFEAIGIPALNEDNNGCNVLLATRSRELCTYMQCQSIIELNLLSQEEAWTLFRLFTRITDDSPNDLIDVGRKIAHECKGLPIAIVTVGSTLRGKSYEEWELTLSRLEESQPMDVPKGLTSPYACLKLSYDSLTNQIAKTLFLLCSIFPEDYEIEEEDLVRFGKVLGPIGTIGVMDKARKEMHAAINILMDSCLLLHSNKKGCIKMHDMVRDVALWIASKKGEAILVETGMDPRMLVENEAIRDKTTISLWDLMNGQLPVNQLNLPTLEILLLHSKSGASFEVPDAHLEWMKKLKILAFIRFTYNQELFISRLTNTSMFTLAIPQSIESSTILRSLCLRGYKLSNISVLESLKGLEILDLRGSSFDELPNGITTLKKLKLLDLYSCWIDKNNTYEVIGRCSQLEELHLFLWKIGDVSLDNVSFARLRRYSLIHSKINSNYNKYSSIVKFLEDHVPSRALCIEGFNANAQSFASLPIKDLFLRSESLYLMHLQGGYKNIIPTMDQQGMNYLTCLVLEHCSEISCLVDTTAINMNANTNNPHDSWSQTKAVFSRLVTLRLHHMYGLEQVFHDPSSCCSLKKLEELRLESCTALYSMSFPRLSNLCGLKILKIEKCQMLTSSLFMPFIAQTLESLEELVISKCSKLKNIIAEDEEEERNVQSLTSLVLPNLRILRVDGCERLETILPITSSQGLVRLEMMQIGNNDRLKFVFWTQKEHNFQLYQHINSKESNFEMNLLALRSLTLSSLSNLIDIWPESCHPRSPNLKTIECSKCPRLSATSVRKVMINSYKQQDKTTTEKDSLWVVDINFNQLSNKIVPLALQAVLNFRILHLTHLRVGGIIELQIKGEPSNISKPEQHSNSELKALRLLDLPDLSLIWKGPTKFLSLQKLSYVYVDKCPKLKAIFSSTIVMSLPMLSILKVFNCEELEQIFVSDDDDDDAEQFCTQKAVCFPKLWYIVVGKCNNLRWLFSKSMAYHFPYLDTLEVTECSKLEKIFGFANEVDDNKDGEQVMLQNLRNIILKNLPNFIEILRGFRFQRQVRYDIVNCPTYDPRTHKMLIKDQPDTAT